MLLRVKWNLSTSLFKAEVAMDSYLEMEVTAEILAEKVRRTRSQESRASVCGESLSKLYRLEVLFSNCAPSRLSVLWKSWVGVMDLGSSSLFPSSLRTAVRLAVIYGVLCNILYAKIEFCCWKQKFTNCRCRPFACWTQITVVSKAPFALVWFEGTAGNTGQW